MPLCNLDIKKSKRKKTRFPKENIVKFILAYFPVFLFK